MKKISLTRGKVALVDDADYDWLNQWKWYAHYDKNTDSFYVVRNSTKVNGNRYMIRMHRQILGLGREDKRQVDHKNHAPLDNRRSNLRICTNQQNQRNQKHHLNSSSKYKGVRWHKRAKKWESAITINKRRKYLGLFSLEKLAALSYDIAAIREYGEFATLNF